jgi:cobalt/nickel transport protein
VQIGDLNKDLTGTLQETTVLDNMAWKGLYGINKPGIYTFYFVPQPYYEPAEEKYIIHMTKVYVPALGYEEEWDQMVGLKAEIQPLTRPFGLYAGNVFKGVLKFKGKPLPEADVEVEFWNAGGKVEPPNDYFVTQVVKTDDNGVFSFSPPKAGWWGFAGLAEEKNAIRHVDGKKKTAEYGAVLWVYFNEFPAPKQ